MTITATIIADSISSGRDRITTYELEYPRFIHAEFMTHRLFSRNAASSRAIPVKRSIELIKADTARPSHWGKNQPGMSAKEECDKLIKIHWGDDFDTNDYPREEWWDRARDAAIYHAQEFDKAGYHKQIVNRGLEPYSHIKVVCTATEYDNFFWLRRHPDAQPEIHELADRMWEARQVSTPKTLHPGEWHVPYFRDGYWAPSISANAYTNYAPEDIEQTGYSLQDALAVSASCCAQVSYRKLDNSPEKAADIFKRLVESTPVHASPFEHQATPMDESASLETDGVTHWSKDDHLWSGNFKWWIQHRQLIPNNVCELYAP